MDRYLIWNLYKTIGKMSTFRVKHSKETALQKVQIYEDFICVLIMLDLCDMYDIHDQAHTWI